jgi:hypothetical protein
MILPKSGLNNPFEFHSDNKIECAKSAFIFYFDAAGVINEEDNLEEIGHILDDLMAGFKDLISESNRPVIIHSTTPALEQLDKMLTKEQIEEIATKIRGGNKIGAIIKIRNYLGWGLKEGKELADKLWDELK